MLYVQDTELAYDLPWGATCKGKALCPDGKVRAFHGGTADTFFSIPVRIKAYGKTVSGFVTVETVEGYTTPTPDDPAVVKFIPYKYGKNGNIFEGRNAG